MISAANILDRSKLNRLYNLLDFCLVSSRWEGGPHSILEACFAKTKVLSTRVGISEDVLEEASLFDTIPEAVSRIFGRHPVVERWTRPENLNTAGCSPRIPRRDSLKHCAEFTNAFPRSRRKGIAEAARAWLRTQTRAHLRRRSQPPTVIGLLAGNAPGKLFPFPPRNVAAEREPFVLRETIAGDCRSLSGG